MGSLGPNDMATMYEARKKVNNDRQTGLVDVPRLRAEVLAMHSEQNVSDEAAMKIKYAYLAKASPSLFALLCKGTDFRLDAIMKLLDAVLTRRA